MRGESEDELSDPYEYWTHTHVHSREATCTCTCIGTCQISVTKFWRTPQAYNSSILGPHSHMLCMHMTPSVWPMAALLLWHVHVHCCPTAANHSQVLYRTQQCTPEACLSACAVLCFSVAGHTWNVSLKGSSYFLEVFCCVRGNLLCHLCYLGTHRGAWTRGRGGGRREGRDGAKEQGNKGGREGGREGRREKEREGWMKGGRESKEGRKGEW